MLQWWSSCMNWMWAGPSDPWTHQSFQDSQLHHKIIRIVGQFTFTISAPVPTTDQKNHMNFNLPSHNNAESWLVYAVCFGNFTLLLLLLFLLLLSAASMFSPSWLHRKEGFIGFLATHQNRISHCTKIKLESCWLLSKRRSRERDYDKLLRMTEADREGMWRTDSYFSHF